MDAIYKLVQIIVCILDAYLIIDFFLAFFRLKELFVVKYPKAGLVLVAAICVYGINSLNSTTVNLIGTSTIYLFVIVIFFSWEVIKEVSLLYNSNDNYVWQ